MPHLKRTIGALGPDHATMVCCHIFDRSRDALDIAIDEDERLIVDCGDEQHGEGDWHFLALGPLLQLDPTLHNAPAITPQEYCERAFRGGPWWIAHFGPDED